MERIFGDFITDLPGSEEYLIIGFSPASISLQQRWRNNGLSADFLADYLTTFFPGNDENSNGISSQAELKNSISYIANELLENAMKYNDKKCNHPISIQLHLKSDRIVLMVTNSVVPQKVDEFQAYLEELTTSNVEDLLVRQLEKNALEENSHSSGLGYLTIIGDYMAKMGWRFSTVQEEPEVVAVSTMVQLQV
ncbi:MAG: DUF6272 family protein [Cyanobacteriota bacterium]|nr:DUF6272 family protein [Cyanobacteriota bacterium]